MGGNVFKNKLNMVRYNKQDYDDLCKDIVSDLNYYFELSDIKDLKYSVIPSYKNKQDFGDLDLLITNNVVPKEIIPNLWVNSNINIVVNDECTSFPYNYVRDSEYFQVDIIAVNPKYYDFSLNYFSYNDTGNLIGRIVHKLGYRFGHKGLYYIIRDGNYVISEIEVSTNFLDTLEFFEFPNYTNWEFNDIEDIFKYPINCPYFSKQIYQYDNLNHDQRVRDRKRKTYHSFLQYIENKQFKNNFDYSGDNKENLRKEFLSKGFEYFPGFKENYDQAMVNYALKKELKEKFNGDIVANLTGLKDKELGSFVQKFKAYYNLQEYSKEEIEKMILIDYKRSLQSQNYVNKITLSEMVKE